MSDTCVIMPKKGKGQTLFNDLKKEFGYERAWELWSLSQSNSLMPYQQMQHSTLMKKVRKISFIKVQKLQKM